MPPRKDRAASEKAAVARDRKAAVAAEKDSIKKQQDEDAKWADEGSTAKERRARERAEKEEERRVALDKKKALKEQDEEFLKPVAKPKKMTMYDLHLMKEQQKAVLKKKRDEEEIVRQKIIMLDPLQITNVNHEVAVAMEEDILKYGSENVKVAYDVEGAIQALSFHHAQPVSSLGPSDRMAEKKRKAAFKAFEAERMPELKADFPDLKLSQLKDKLMKEWDRSSNNPKNQH